jgi:ketosteroid isomerase-like protein
MKAYAAVMEWLEHLGPFDSEIREILDAGGDEVLVCGCVRLGDAPGELPIFHVMRVRDGKIDRVRAYFHRDEALKAVGLDA